MAGFVIKGFDTQKQTTTESHENGTSGVVGRTIGNTSGSSGNASSNQPVGNVVLTTIVQSIPRLFNVGSTKARKRNPNEVPLVSPTSPTSIGPVKNPYCDEDECQHKSTTETKKDPTCTKTGTITITCNDCGCSWESEIPKLGHDFSVYVDATNHKCSRCGELQKHGWNPIF